MEEIPSVYQASVPPEERIMQLMELLYGNTYTSVTLPSYLREQYENELATLEAQVAASTAVPTTPVTTAPTTTPAPTSNQGVTVPSAGIGPTPYVANNGETYYGEEAEEKRIQDYNNDALSQSVLAYSAGQISYEDYVAQSQAIRAYMRAGEYYTATPSMPGGGGYSTSYSSGGGGTSAGGSSVSSDYSEAAQAIYDAQQEALARQEELYNEAKAAIDAAYTSGLMSDTEYNSLLTSTRETIEAQYTELMSQVSRSYNTGYGPSGAAQTALGNVATDRIGAVAGGDRDVNIAKALQESEAAAARAAGYTNLMSLYDIPYPEIPEGLSSQDLTMALTGTPGEGSTYNAGAGGWTAPPPETTPTTSESSYKWELPAPSLTTPPSTFPPPTSGGEIGIGERLWLNPDTGEYETVYY